MLQYVISINGFKGDYIHDKMLFKLYNNKKNTVEI